MRLRSIILLVIMIVSPIALAKTLVIYPLDSQDVLLGVAVADRLTQALDDQVDVIGPDVSPSLAPPLVTEDGFISLLGFLSRGESNETASIGGAKLLRDILGTDEVLTGRISFMSQRVTAKFYLASEDEVHTFSVTAPEDNPSLLVQKAVALLAERFAVPRPDTLPGIDLSEPYGDYVRALTFVGGGFLEEAREVLQEADSDTEPRVAELLQNIEAVQLGQEGTEPALMATMSLALNPLDEALTISYFQAFDEQSDLAVTKTWLATLYASDNQDDIAKEAFRLAAETYPYGMAAELAYLIANGEDADLASIQTSEHLGSVLAASLIANLQGDISLEKQALERITRLAPDFAYPFERLSFIAFDEEDALAAGQALAVAVILEPESSLYWTNLGWAYYLLGVLDKSEEASTRAISLDSNQFIALYNLGLAQVVTDRLDEAMLAYQEALSINPDVDDEAIKDLENALELYPQATGVHFALATLYEQEGRRTEAEKQFEMFLAKGADDSFKSRAEQRIEVLRAPLPAIEISKEATLGLGPELLEATPFHPGDRIFPSFELFTPGDALPTRVDLSLNLRTEEDSFARIDTEVDIPSNAIGYVIDAIGVDIPFDLAEGSYTIDVEIQASEDRKATTSFEFEVLGEPSFVRRLISRNINMRALENDALLYSSRDLERSDDALLALLVEELRQTSDAAEDALPEINEGRFAGFSGGKLFSESNEEDIEAFLEFLLLAETSDANFSFVDAYAQWAIDGAPASLP